MNKSYFINKKNDYLFTRVKVETAYYWKMASTVARWYTSITNTNIEITYCITTVDLFNVGKKNMYNKGS